MKKPRSVRIDWESLRRAFERYDPDGIPLPYLNLRTGRVTFFGEGQDLDLADTLDFDRHVAVHLPPHTVSERHARMRAFAATVAEPALSERLREALSREGGIGTFYDILREHPSAADRWRRQETPRIHEAISEWIRAEQLIPDTHPPWNKDRSG